MRCGRRASGHSKLRLARRAEPAASASAAAARRPPGSARSSRPEGGGSGSGGVSAVTHARKRCLRACLTDGSREAHASTFERVAEVRSHPCGAPSWSMSSCTVAGTLLPTDAFMLHKTLEDPPLALIQSQAAADGGEGCLSEERQKDQLQPSEGGLNTFAGSQSLLASTSTSDNDENRYEQILPDLDNLAELSALSASPTSEPSLLVTGSF